MSQTAPTSSTEQITLLPPASEHTTRPRTATAATAGPPQSAAYPAMRSAVSQHSMSGQATPPSVQAPSSAPCTTTDQASATASEPVSEKAMPEDTIIAGRKGSSSGTIAVPSGQAPVPWPAVTGAPAGYPGEAITRTSLRHQGAFDCARTDASL